MENDRYPYKIIVSFTREQETMLKWLASADDRSINSYIRKLIESDYAANSPTPPTTAA